MAPESAQSLFRQCTRHAPEFEGPAWRPTAAQMGAIETELSEKLEILSHQNGVSPEYPFEYVQNPQSWVEQFAGYHSRGRQMIFLNLHPLSERHKDFDFSTGVIIVCDGSPSYFSVEYDVQKKAIVRISFNYGWVNVNDLTY